MIGDRERPSNRQGQGLDQSSSDGDDEQRIRRDLTLDSLLFSGDAPHLVMREQIVKPLGVSSERKRCYDNSV